MIVDDVVDRFNAEYTRRDYRPDSYDLVCFTHEVLNARIRTYQAPHDDEFETISDDVYTLQEEGAGLQQIAVMIVARLMPGGTG